MSMEGERSRGRKKEPKKSEEERQRRREKRGRGARPPFVRTSEASASVERGGETRSERAEGEPIKGG